MTDGVVGIETTNSVPNRRRLPFRLIDLIPILIALALAWRLFGEPYLAREHIAPVPTNSFTLLDGRTLDLTSLRGRVVFVTFFATWCEPCREEFPVLQRYAAQHPDIQLIMIDIGQSKRVLPAFLRARQLAPNTLIAIDPHGRLVDPWQISGIPTVVGIDPRGFMRDRWFGGGELLPPLLEQARRHYFDERRDAKKAAMASRDS